MIPMRRVYRILMIADLWAVAIAGAAAPATLGFGKHAMQSAAHNHAAELAVQGFDIASSFQGTQAAPGRAFVIVQVHWKNILTPVAVSESERHPDATMGAGGLGAGAAPPAATQGKTTMVRMPYVIPDVKTQLQLIVNGKAGAVLVNDRFHGADLLPNAIFTVSPGADEQGRYVYEVGTPITSLVLTYFDKAYGDIRIPLGGEALAAPAKLIAGPAVSGALMLSVMDVEEVGAIGTRQAPAGTRYVVVSLTGQGAPSVGDDYVEVEPAAISRLAESDGYLYAPLADSNLDGVWSGVVRFVPGTPSDGKLAFEVPADHGPLSLSVMVPGEVKPMQLPLSPAAKPVPPPPAVVTIADGDTGDFYVYGVSRAQTFGTAKTGAGQEFVVLDVGIRNKTGSGMDFQTQEQILLLDGGNTIAPGEDDLAADPRALPEDGVIPAHTLGRYRIPFRVPAGATNLTVYYRGFENEQKTPLPAGQ